MPHKRNPELCERICGLARLVRGYSLTAMENIALWHERDISHSSTERIILPDSCLVVDYTLGIFTSVMQGLPVYPQNPILSTTIKRTLRGVREFRINLSFLLSNGRAVIYSIYKGTFERGLDAFVPGAPSRRYTEYLAYLVKDVRRSIDFLETRPEIDKGKIAYLGFSWGGRLGAIIPAVESRLKISILKVGGLGYVKLPESDEITYVTRVKIPTLMLSGKYDMDFSYEKSARPMFELLGTPKEDKLQKTYETDHYVPYTEFVKETLAWLDKYFGPPLK